MLTAEEGQAVSEEIKAVKFIECSALTQENLPEVFTETIRAVIQQDKDGGGEEKAKKNPAEKSKKTGEKSGSKKSGEKKDGKKGKGGLFKKKK